MTAWLTADEQRAWRAYLRMVLLVDAAVARELTRDTGLSMPDYQVLAELSESAERRCRLSQLAANMQWSASRLSHHVSRMQQRGLVERAECPSDARGAFVVLTDAGFEAIRRAAPDHVASVRRHLIDRLTPGQLAALADLGETVVAHFDETGPPPGDQEAAAEPGQSAKASPDSRSYAST